MTTRRNRRPAAALERHSQSDLVPQQLGPVNFAFGKEALLALYTTIRPEREPTMDFFLREAERRNAGMFTTSHVVAEAVSTVRSKRTANAATSSWNDSTGSRMHVLHGTRPWGRVRGEVEPKEVADGVRKLYATWDPVDFKFHEGTLVLDAGTLNQTRDAETTYVVTFDGTVTNLAWREHLNVLPVRTPHRSDDRS